MKGGRGLRRGKAVRKEKRKKELRQVFHLQEERKGGNLKGRREGTIIRYKSRKRCKEQETEKEGVNGITYCSTPQERKGEKEGGTSHASSTHVYVKKGIKSIWEGEEKEGRDIFSYNYEKVKEDGEKSGYSTKNTQRGLKGKRGVFLPVHGKTKNRKKERSFFLRRSGERGEGKGFLKRVPKKRKKKKE